MARNLLKEPRRSGVNTHDAPLGDGRPWTECDVTACGVDSGLLVTSVNHTQDLMRLDGQQTGRSGEGTTSAEWLEACSLRSSGLTLTHLLSHCTSTLLLDGEDGRSRQLEISAASLSAFQLRLYQAIELHHSRIQWLTQGSMKVFGLVKGSRVGVLIDTSDVNCTMGRLLDLQRNLLSLIEQQLCLKRKLHPMSFGTEVSSLWNNPEHVNPFRLKESREWVQQLKAGGGCNLLQALKRALACTQLDSLLLVLGSCPDQTSDALFDYVEQCMLGRALSVHTVAYCCSSPVAIETAKRLAEVTGGRYHLFSAASGVVDGSTDLELLWAEIKAAREVLVHIQDMQHGRFRGMLVTVVQEISTELGNLSLYDSVPKAHHCTAPLCIQPPGIQPITSAEWLKHHGLRAKKLGLYQVLAPNAYSTLEEFVPILGKTVSSTVHEKAMVQFEWHDGTVKNVHVDLPLLYNYQKQLVSAVRLLERRVLWLSSAGSRQVWGTLCEPRVQILVDVSRMNAQSGPLIQHSLRLLLEQQLANRHSFNVIMFGTDIKPWRERMAPPLPENLQAAWQWIQGVQCAGGRNTLGALRRALEGELHGESPLTQGLYLFTSGVPDQDTAAVCAYVSERCSGSDLRLHVCLFTDDAAPQSCAPPRFATRAETALALRELARAGNGRFRWVSETGIVESDDISVLIGEMETAANYWQKCSLLLDALTRRAGSGAPGEGVSPQHSAPARSTQTRTRGARLPLPRPTAVSLARLLTKDKGQDKCSLQRGIKTWRPSSAKAVIPPAQPVNGWELAGIDAKPKKVSQSVFYMEDGNNLGMVFKTYPKPASVRRSITSVKLPKHEEVCSSKQGAVRHLQLTPGELKQYLTQTDRLLQRYCQRLQWLLSGSRRVFGAVLERGVCVLLDVSGSMAPCLAALKRELASLIWEQLHHNGVRYTLLAFSGEVRAWRCALVEPSEEACADAVQWVSQLSTHGGTATLQALQAACVLGAPLGCYLISDGKPDSSCSLLLREAERLTAGKQVTIHTISFSCKESAANEFLKEVAHGTGGRFHRAPEDADALAANELLADGFSKGDDRELPAFEGDDMRKLAEEIEKLRHFQKQAKAFRDIILEKKNPEAI